jgi:hypothetical protein
MGYAPLVPTATAKTLQAEEVHHPLPLFRIFQTNRYKQLRYVMISFILRSQGTNARTKSFTRLLPSRCLKDLPNARILAAAHQHASETRGNKCVSWLMNVLMNMLEGAVKWPNVHPSLPQSNLRIHIPE